jgi:hypothetical protein
MRISQPVTVSLNLEQWELLLLGLHEYAQIVQGRIDSGHCTHGLDMGDRLFWIYRYLTEKGNQATVDKHPSIPRPQPAVSEEMAEHEPWLD